MRKWTSIAVLTTVGVMLAGSALAQAGGKSDTTASGTMKSDMPGTGESRSLHEVGRDQVKAAQQVLKDRGHDPGAIDGVMGPKTATAVREFQKKTGIAETGRLDLATMGKLGVRTGGADQAGAGASASPPTVGGSPIVRPKNDQRAAKPSADAYQDK